MPAPSGPLPADDGGAISASPGDSTSPQTNAQAAASPAPVASSAPAPATVGRSGEPTKNAGMITIFPILALSLVVVGILSCVVMKTVAARRAESQESAIKTSMYRSMNGESSTHLYRP